jgi:hypothetical protein
MNHQEDLRVTCDQCGSWQIQHRRKTPLPIRRIKLSEWLLEIPAPRTEPSVLVLTEMVAECLACHFTVEYSKMSI